MAAVYSFSPLWSAFARPSVRSIVPRTAAAYCTAAGSLFDSRQPARIAQSRNAWVVACSRGAAALVG